MDPYDTLAISFISKSLSNLFYELRCLNYQTSYKSVGYISDHTYKKKGRLLVKMIAGSVLLSLPTKNWKS